MTCHEPLPESAYCCELDAGHEGWHRTGPVRWGGGSEVEYVDVVDVDERGQG